MAGRIQVPVEAEEAWSRALGYFIWSMGQIEWQSYEWGLRIGGESLKDKLIDQVGFGSRHKIIVKAIAATNWPLARKKEAAKLWTKALGFSRFRNVVAHNPVIMNRNYAGLFGIVNARSLKGAHGRFHRIYFAPIVYSTAKKMQSLASALDSFWTK
jgi:hypothetical protein